MPPLSSGVATRLPAELSCLLVADRADAIDQAWTGFLETHNRLLLHVARSVGHDYDAAMDAYAHLLGQLRRDDFHRLRAYQSDGRTKFTTWLVVVARRVCLDFVRRRYGRFRSQRVASVQEQQARRQLTDLVGVSLDDVPGAASHDPAPDHQLVATEQSARLAAAVGRLDPTDQLLLKLRFDDDRTMQDIAAVLGYGTRLQVHRHLRRVLTRLRAMLTPGASDGQAGSAAAAGPFHDRDKEPAPWTPAREPHDPS